MYFLPLGISGAYSLHVIEENKLKKNRFSQLEISFHLFHCHDVIRETNLSFPIFPALSCD